MENILRLENINKSYKDLKVLKNINLDIRRNLIYGLIGPNGSGKTTLMKVILSYLKFSGKVYINNKIENNDAIKINYVPEIINFYEYLTGKQAATLITEMQGFVDDEIYSTFEKLSFLLGYKDENKLIKQHSKGNLRKLMLLQSLSVNSDLLLLDEPFSGLDPISIEKLKPLLIEKKKSNTTYLINTHLFDVAKSVCDVLIFIKEGEIIFQTGKNNFAEINLVELFESER